jgi:hypothetical protein
MIYGLLQPKLQKTIIAFSSKMFLETMDFLQITREKIWTDLTLIVFAIFQI